MSYNVDPLLNLYGIIEEGGGVVGDFSVFDIDSLVHFFIVGCRYVEFTIKLYGVASRMCKNDGICRIVILVIVDNPFLVRVVDIFRR